jgi:NAD(P)H-dependent flavin oxidoreductase YrpB (nitropropane dioxygenase family)
MRTAFTDLLGLDVPIVQASLGPWTSVELTAAACDAGALAASAVREVIAAMVTGAQTTLGAVSAAASRG